MKTQLFSTQTIRFFALGLTLGLAGCGDTPQSRQMPTPEVTVEEIKSKDVPLKFEYSGRTAGSREAEVRAQVSGLLIKKYYIEGQPVKAGQKLFQIDPAPYQAQLDKAQAAFNQAKSEWHRVEGLHKENAISGRDYEKAVAQYHQAQADLKTATLNLGYTTVTAPVTGLASHETKTEGNLIGTTGDSSLLTKITQIDPLYVNFAYPDSDALRRRQWEAAGLLKLPATGKLQGEIYLDSEDKPIKSGEISFTDSIIDPTTSSVKARVIVENADNRLLPGQFVKVVLKDLIRKETILIPDQAVIQGPQGAFVYTVDGTGKAQIAPVELGILIGKNRIIEKGLKSGDKLITRGMIKIGPGALVKQTISSDKSSAPMAAKE